MHELTFLHQKTVNMFRSSWAIFLFFPFRRCAVQSTLGMAPLNLCFYILFTYFYFPFYTHNVLHCLYMTEEPFWTLGTTALTCFRTLYPRTQRGHWRYYFRSTEVNDGRLNNPRRRRKHRRRRAGIRTD